MKNQPGNARAQKCKTTIASIPCGLLFICLAVFAIGCDDKGPLPILTDTDGARISPIRGQAFQIIQAALADPRAEARVHAIEVVVTARQIKFMPSVQRLLRDKVMPVRFAAAVAVGDLEYSIAEPVVSPLLRDGDHNVIIAAAYAMGRLGYPEYFEVVRKGLESNDQTVRANAALLLGRMGDPGSLPLLKRAQEDKDSSDKVRFQVLEARARLRDETVLQKLWAIALSGYADDRVMGVRALGALGTSKARDILITKLDDSVLEVRLVVAEQLGKLKDTTGEPEVLAVFEKNLTSGMAPQAGERVNVLTALAIGEIRTPGLTKYLPRLLKNELKTVRIAAAKAVFLCGMR